MNYQLLLYMDTELKKIYMKREDAYQLNLINSAIDLINEYDLLNDKGIIICEYEMEKINREELKILKQKKYGNKYIKIYEK